MHQLQHLGNTRALTAKPTSDALAFPQRSGYLMGKLITEKEHQPSVDRGDNFQRLGLGQQILILRRIEQQLAAIAPAPARFR